MQVTEKHRKKYADLQIQAMLFNMDIDIETWSLVPKVKHQEPKWLANWKDKVSEGDTSHDFGE